MLLHGFEIFSKSVLI